MTRKMKSTDWSPNPDCEAAYGRILAIAHICAASLLGQKLTQDPARDASPMALLHAMGMMYFLCRIDPKDLAAISTGPGSFADFAYKPFPPNFRPNKPMFDVLTAVLGAAPLPSASPPHTINELVR